MSAPADLLERLARPRSIAVAGASPRNAWTLQILKNVRRAGYAGPLYTVHPRLPDVAGVPAFPSLDALPEPPDLVIAALGAEAAVATIEQAAVLGARAAVTFAVGFGEAGDAGAALEARLRACVEETGIALIGPNCQGFMHPGAAVAAWLDLIVRPLPPGDVALLSQSGALCTALLSAERGLGWSFVATTGNETGVGTADLIAALAHDPATRVVLCVLETIRDPEAFLAACELAREQDTYVVVLKLGRTEAAQAAAAAHTGALAAPDDLVDALLRSAGAIRADSMDELLELAALLRHPPADGDGIGLITASGGQSQLLLDALRDTGLEVPALAPATVEALGALFAPGAPIANPLDTWALNDFTNDLGACVAHVLADPGVDLLVFGLEAPAAYPTLDRKIILDAVATLAPVAAEHPGRIVFFSTIGGWLDPDVTVRLDDVRVPVLAGAHETAGALARLRAHRRRAGAATSAPVPPPEVRDVALAGDEAAYAGLPALELLGALGVPVVAAHLAQDADEAVAHAEAAGFPVVLKTAAPDVTHKTERAAVRVGLASAEQVRAAFEALAADGLAEHGVLVQPQAEIAVELLMSTQTHPQLGTFLVVGAGGVLTELLQDVAIRRAPLGADEVEAMLLELRSAALLTGFRGRAPIDLRPLAELGARLAAGALALAGRVATIELNPVIAGADGALALDCLIVPAAGAAEKVPAA